MTHHDQHRQEDENGEGGALREEQEGKGYGEDPGEREGSLESEDERG